MRWRYLAALAVAGAVASSGRGMAMAQRLELTLTLDRPVGERPVAVTGGIPFPKGALGAADRVKLFTASGEQVPLQTRALATWDPEGREVRWLLLDFLARSLAAGRTPFVLVWAKAGEPKAVASVDPAASLWPPRAILAGLYLRDQHGTEYRTSRDPKPLIQVETSGPLRTTVRVQAWYTAPDGSPLCRAVLRLTYRAGLKQVDAHHALVMEADPERFQVRALGFRQTVTRPTARVLLGGGQAGDEALTADGPVALLQDRDDRFMVTGATQAVGRRSGTWLCVSGVAATACFVRHGWEKFPVGLRWTGSGFDMQLWPESAGLPLSVAPIPQPVLNATTEAELREGLAKNPRATVSLYRLVTRGQTDWRQETVVPLMEQAKKLETELLPARFAHYYLVFGRSGRGTMVSHEFTLAELPGTVSGTELADLAGHVRQPPVVSASPEWSCASGAFGPAMPYGRTPFANVDRAITWGELSVHEDFVERLRLYGCRDFGDYVNGNPAMSGPLWQVYGSQGQVRLTDRIGWNNTESQDSTHGPWVQLLRTGDPRIRRVAETMAEHFATVDQRHEFGDGGEHRAVTQYHSINHYDGGDCPSHTLNMGLALGYYVTGNPWWREVAVANADHFLAVQAQDGQGWYDPSHDPSRQTSAGLTCMLNAYTLTWDRKYLDSLHAFLKVWAPVYDVAQHYMGGTLGLPGAEFALSVDDPEFLAALRAAMDGFRDRVTIDGNSVYYLPGMVALWRKTADPTYLAYCHFVLLWHDWNLRQRGHSDMVGREVLGFPEFGYGFVAGHVAAGLAGLEEGRRQGVDMRAAMGALQARRAEARKVAPKDALFYATDVVIGPISGRWEPPDE